MPSESVKFLLVDDLEENLIALEAMLRRDGLELLKAYSGTEALELLLVHDFALALLDVQIPGMDGFELAELMRGAERTRRIPIIFITAGLRDEERRFRGYEAGAVDFIFKPIEPHILRSKAEVFFELHRQRQELIRQRDELRASEERLQLAVEALREADQRKDEFLAMLAHELRNPLAPIRNAAQVMKLAGPTQPDQQWACEVIERQTQHLTRLVDDLMDVSRITSGKVALRREPLELSTIINRVVETSRLLIDARRQHLTVTLPPELAEPTRVEGDLTRLTQVVSNLLNNAAKYTDEGGHIELTAAEENGEAVIRVRDDGIGMPVELLPHVFSLFTQADRSLDRSQGGLGIGLTLVRNIVEMHGGRVAARSEGPGRGSEFIVRLPALRIADSGLRIEEDSAIPQSTIGAPHLRVLVVEDNVDSAEMMAFMLKLGGHEVRMALDGPSSLEAACAFLPQVVLCDIGLPGMNGYEVAARLRQQPEFKQTRLIALTGYGQEEARHRSKEAGFDYHLVKPIEPDALDALLDSIRANERA